VKLGWMLESASESMEQRSVPCLIQADRKGHILPLTRYLTPPGSCLPRPLLHSLNNRFHSSCDATFFWLSFSHGLHVACLCSGAPCGFSYSEASLGMHRAARPSQRLTGSVWVGVSCPFGANAGWVGWLMNGDVGGDAAGDNWNIRGGCEKGGEIKA
jgi:hypothetical protein